jgi:hypothetical protein
LRGIIAEVSFKPADGFAMWDFQDGDETSTLVHCHCNIWTHRFFQEVELTDNEAVVEVFVKAWLIGMSTE